MRGIAIITGLTVSLLAPTSGAQTLDVRYVVATELRLRATPSPGAAALGHLRINEPVEMTGVQEGTWCSVTARAGTLSGWAGCAYLSPQPLTLDRISEEVADATLALYRSAKPVSDSAVPKMYSYTQFNDPKLARTLSENLFSQLERHFALSPSLHTLGQYEDLVTFASRLTDAAKVDPALGAMAASRKGTLRAMRKQLVESDTTAALPVVRHPATALLRMVLSERAPGGTRRAAKRAEALARASGDSTPAVRASFFRDDLWSVGWAGGPLAHRTADRDSDGVVYAVSFDGPSYRSLAAVYEMAKARRAAVRVEFKSIFNKGDLAQMAPTADGGPDGLVLSMRLPVWGITAEGLVPGILRRISYGGDVCSGSDNRSMPTQIEVAFPEALRGELHGVFATNADIDSGKAKVSVRKRTFLQPLADVFGENTLTHRVDMRVDLDGDGIDDLRTVVSQDTSVGRRNERFMDGVLARHMPDDRWLRPAAGWYAYNVYMLQANQDGWWQSLSIYNVVTCT